MEEKEKKKRLIGRLKDKLISAWKSFSWKNPIHRWQFLFFAVLFIVVGYFAFTTSLQATSTRAFCSACHIMTPENVTHDLTVHAEFKCIDCHIEPGKMEYYKAKTIGAAPKAWYVTLGDLRNPIYMAKAPVSNGVCQKCHSDHREVTPRGDLIVNHQGHIAEDILCVTCHSGVAHAKIVERGLNFHEDLEYWTMENGEHLVSDANVRTNMGTCIDCHIRYNYGERPWEVKYYSLSYPPGKYESQSFGLYETFEIMKKQEENLEEGQISHTCATCHTHWDIPENHNRRNFVNDHGDDALNELASCINCHEDAKWVKDLPQEDFEENLDPRRDLAHYKPDIFVVSEMAKETKFCASCHEERPEGHLTSDIWLTAHADPVQTRDDLNRCLVCHDYDEAVMITEEQFRDLNITAPTDVYCTYCHRTGLATVE
ncbi:MAG: NapC/NirT family cytochrome c [Bacillus sp. (in: Bacteria)]|nr:NapC/NirT family cytochrome c [Bacillus sp. (in: firmicutes)]